MRLWKIVKFIFLLSLFSGNAFALSEPKLFSSISNIPGATLTLKNLADSHITTARDQNGQALIPLSVNEIKNGVIPLDMANRVIDRGVFSAYALWCGDKDWEKKSYLKFMTEARGNTVWTDRQLSYMGLLHGVTMGFIEKQLSDLQKSCTSTDKQKVDSYFRYLEDRHYFLSSK